MLCLAPCIVPLWVEHGEAFGLSCNFLFGVMCWGNFLNDFDFMISAIFPKQSLPLWGPSHESLNSVVVRQLFPALTTSFFSHVLANTHQNVICLTERGVGGFAVQEPV